METKQTAQSLWQRLKELATLKLEYAKLTAAERLSILLSTVAIALICLVGVSMFLFFISMSLVEVMATSIGMAWSSFIVSMIYVAVLVIVVMLRKQLIINPIARFVSKIML